MSIKFKNLLRTLSLVVLLTSFIPLNHTALAAPVLPPVDMFQLPWDQGLAWMAIDGIDNGSKRPDTSSHNYSRGGAIDFAPKNYMVTGEDTSNFWVAAAAAGTVIEVSGCHLKIAHANGWITEYQFLAKVQVKLGDVVARNQRLGIIADGVKYRYCPGYEEPNKPHLHFILRPSIIGATFAGWEVRYSSFWNSTTFRKGNQTLGLYKPLLNVFDTQPIATPTLVPSLTSVPPTSTVTPPSGPYVSTTANLQSVDVGGMALATVSLNNVPTEGYTSAEFTCTYNASLVEVSNVVPTNLFGADAASAIQVPQAGNLIVAIAGSHGNKAATSGAAFTFDVKGLQAGETALVCTARVSKGDNVLTGLPFVGTSLNVLAALPTPTLVLPPMTPTIVPTACDQAEFVADITIPSGTVMSPSTMFKKTWRLRNAGWCTWTPAYQFVFFSGDQMGAPASANFSTSVQPGQVVDFSLDMIAPSVVGSYQSNWRLKNANGALFGVGANANESFSVNINVSGSTATPSPASSPTPSITPSGPTNSPTPSIPPSGPTATPAAGVAYDFAANACAAVWSSGAGQLPCPGIDGDARGFVLIRNNPVLETGVTDTRQGLLTFPQNIQNGYIQGTYPAFHVQSGDRFQSRIGCEGGATSCYVAFRLDYQTGSDPIKTFWGPFLERYDGRDYSVDVDLSSLAGKDVKFILTILAAGSPTGDRALWVNPVITRTSVTSDWLTYINPKHGFQFKYPREGTYGDGMNDNYARITLPIVPGTNLSEKYLEVVVGENVTECKSPLQTQDLGVTVTINGISFLKQTGEEGAAGSLYQWVAYSARRDNVCVSLDFILRSHNPGVYPTPPPLFDYAAESAVFGQIVATYAWFTLPTATPGFETPLPVETSTSTPTPAQFPTASPSPTATSISGTAITGQVIASKIVTVRVYDTEDAFVASVNVNADGTFRFDLAAGTYTLVATANGFLRVQGTVTLADGETRAMPVIALLAGDIDDNGIIDQFDAMTVGMSYNTAEPPGADFNNDGIINVLDLEILARNYRKAGPVAWQ